MTDSEFESVQRILKIRLRKAKSRFETGLGDKAKCYVQSFEIPVFGISFRLEVLKSGKAYLFWRSNIKTQPHQISISNIQNFNSRKLTSELFVHFIMNS